MYKGNLIESYVNEKDFEILGYEMLDVTYSKFCDHLIKNNLFIKSNFLSSIKVVLSLKDFFSTIQSSKVTNKEYLLSLEIVLYTALVEGYSAPDNYVKIERFLKREFTDGMSKKQLTQLITRYQNENSLTAFVRRFAASAPYLDQIYLASCIQEAPEIKSANRPLDIISFMLKKQLDKSTDIRYQQLSTKIQILNELRTFVADRTNLIHLSEFDQYFKNQTTDAVTQKEICIIANQLYTIRSKFMHTMDKKAYFGIHLDTDKGNIFNFEDIDFFRLFIRTLLFINNFQLDVTKIASKSPF